MRVAPVIKLSSEVRLELEKLSRRRTTPVRVAQRSRIVLLAADRHAEQADCRADWAWRHVWRRCGGAGFFSLASPD